MKLPFGTHRSSGEENRRTFFLEEAIHLTEDRFETFSRRLMDEMAVEDFNDCTTIKREDAIRVFPLSYCEKS